MALDRQPTLRSSLVVVRPMVADDLDGLSSLASDPLVWEQHPSKERSAPSAFAAYFEEGLASGGALTLVDALSGEVFGMTRYGLVDELLDEVEIGWTFIARDRWGGPWNAEVKRLMLAHAFESVGCVVFRVHSDNLRSQRAVEKLGAVRSGVEEDALGRGTNVVFRLRP